MGSDSVDEAAVQLSGSTSRAMMVSKRLNKTRLSFIALLIALASGTLLFLYGHQVGKKEQQPVRIDLSAVGQPGQNVMFNAVDQVKSLPQAVRNEIGDLAEPGESFQSTDVVRGKRLPSRRLIFAGISERYSIVHYERGGIAHSFLVAVVELSNGKANVVWVSNAGHMADLRELKTTLEAGKLPNELGRTAW
jgi:hypothetical protein